MKSIIVAYSKNHVIGLGGDIPWMGKLPADLKHFKELTSGHAVIMGRKTFESIGRPLPNRHNIVISSQDITIDGVDVVDSLSAGYAAAKSDTHVFIIGGGSVYTQALRDTEVDLIYVTEIDEMFEGDTFFPELGDEWREIERSKHLKKENNQFDYSFVTLTRRQSAP